MPTTGIDSVKPPVPLLDSAAQARAQRRIDSIATFRRGDTIKAPLAHFEIPLSLDIDNRLRFNRNQILTSEATNLSELLALVPGVTRYATGWLASAQMAAYGGDFARVRVFMDGIEMDANDTRSNGILDLVDVHLWLLDEIVIERAAGEIRVWCRTSSTTRMTPYTRTDVYTGDLNTNGFRGLFSRRFMNGAALSVNGEQFATQQGRQSQFGTTTAVGKGDGGGQILNARVGYARGKWSGDVYGVVSTRDRDSQAGFDSTPPIKAYRGARREGLVRVGYGDTASGMWSQLVFNSLRTRLEGLRAKADTDTTIHSDTTRSREQKMFAIGYRTNTMQLSFTERLRTFNGQAWSSPALRAGYSSRLLAAGLFAERQALDSSKHVEGGVLWRDRWFTVGAIRQSDFLQKPPTLLTGNSVTQFATPASLGLTFGARGKLYREIGLDVQGVRWNGAAVYRPQFSTRTDLSLVTNWLSRFPKGEFGVNLHVIHELRDPITFSFTSDTTRKQVVITSLRSQIFTTLFEIRIQRAVIFYHFHNMTGQPYELVPGIVMPRQVQMYGVRWEFWN